MKRRSFRDMLPNIAGRKGAILSIDLLLAGIALLLLQLVLFNFKQYDLVLLLTAVTMAIAAPALYLVQAHSQIWQRVSMPDLLALLAASAATAALIAIFSLTIYPAWVAIRVFLGTGVMLTAAWSGPRLLYRLWGEWRDAQVPGRFEEAEPVILYGSGSRADQFIRVNAMTKRYHILGFFHEDPRFTGRRIRGIAAHGSLDNISEFLAAIRARGYHPKRLIVTEDGETPDELAAALDCAAVNGLRLARLPSMLGLLESAGGEMLRSVSIEDILHRDQVRLNHSSVGEAIAGAIVMVTGAGGSIGSELVRQIAGFAPAKIILAEFSEFNLYQIDGELARAFPRIPRVTALCDVRDIDALRRVFVAHRPNIVLHAAALKHVPMLESHPDQAVLTNILGTLNVARLAREHDVEVMTLVSTDKAVNPTNVMGCTKRWAEIICQAFDAEREANGSRTRFVCVRFGNVLDSAGSVVPLFRKQIAEGGPVTVTHSAVTRYFMTIPEACELILAATGATREFERRHSQVYVLDMGEPIRIFSLAERMIQLHGLRPHEDIKIAITGLRKGEKLFEELAHDEEDLSPAPFPKANLARSRAPAWPLVAKAIEGLLAAARQGDHADIVANLRSLAPEFVADGTPAVPAAVTPAY